MRFPKEPPSSASDLHPYAELREGREEIEIKAYWSAIRPGNLLSQIPLGLSSKSFRRGSWLEKLRIA